MVYVYSIFGDTLPKEDLRRDINPALLEIENHTRSFHQPIVSAAYATASPGQQPDIYTDEALIYLGFEIGTHEAFRQFKIPGSFVGDPTFHIHWTKTGDADESGKVARWRVSYIVFPSTTTTAGQGNATPVVEEVEDTYEDDGTTTRLIYRTPDVAMSGFQAGYYVSMKVESITPVGAAMASDPGLFSLDMKFTEYINNGA